MKIFLLILIFFCDFSFEKFNYSKPINDVIQNLFNNKETISFDVLIICEKNSSSLVKISHILNEIEIINGNNFKLQTIYVHDIEKLAKLKIGIDKSYVCLFCTNKQLLHFNSATFLTNSMPKKIKILIFSLEPMNNFKNIWNDVTFHKYFLNNTKKSLELSTIEFYTTQSCNQPQKVVLNVFNKKSQKWKNSLEIAEKFENFHGCLFSIEVEFASGFTFKGN